MEDVTSNMTISVIIDCLACPELAYSWRKDQKGRISAFALVANTKSFMFPIIKVMRDINNITISVILNTFSMPKSMLFVRK